MQKFHALALLVRENDGIQTKYYNETSKSPKRKWETMLCGDKQIVLWYFLKWPIKIAKQCPSIPPKVCGFCFDTFL